MRHPPYHLRPNKAVDRLFLFEAIRYLDKLADLGQYTYYSLGGPYLEDFRLLYELYPEIKMESIESNKETLKRQEFHRPCVNMGLSRATFKSFIASYDPMDEKSIFWLDYTGLEYGNFEDFMVLLAKVAEQSMIKITLRSQPSDFSDKPGEIGVEAERFRRQFGAIMPDPVADPPHAQKDFAYLLQKMLQVASQKALPSSTPLMFLPISSFYYSDGAGMFTLTGVVCRREREDKTRDTFKRLHFSNFDWTEPRRIDVPVLSTKERLHLQRLLPCSRNAGRTLLQELGYLVDDNESKTEAQLEQYAQFHRYYPFFMEGVP